MAGRTERCIPPTGASAHRAAATALVVLLCAAAPASGQYRARANLNGRSIGMGEVAEDPQIEQENARKACQMNLDRARQALDEGKLGLAGHYLAMARDLAVDQSQAQAVAEAHWPLNQAAEQRLTQADQQFAAGDYAPALKEYASVAAALGRLPAGLKAKRKLDEAERNPAVRAALNEAKAAALYEPLLGALRDTPPASDTQPADEAQRFAGLPIERQARLLRHLQSIGTLYGDCPTGRAAQALLQQLQADERLMQAIAAWEQQAQARRAFEKARMYHNARLYAKASQAYSDVYENYPDSPYAEQARQQQAAVDAILSVTPQ